jgi:hypothetical protein
VAIPRVIIGKLTEHLDTFVAPDGSALVFTSPMAGRFITSTSAAASGFRHSRQPNLVRSTSTISGTPETIWPLPRGRTSGRSWTGWATQRRGPH